MHPTLVNSFAVTRICVEIRPSSLNGLILYNNRPDYIAILLRNGTVDFHYNLGGGSTVIVSNTVLTTEEWHSIEVSRSGRSGSLIVNNQIPVTGESPEGYHSLQLNGDLLIGGLVNNVRAPFDLGTVQHFHGCIRELRTDTNGGQSVPIVSAAHMGADILECPTCNCRNGGYCIEDHSGSYYCDCPLEFTGLICENDLCTINNLCQNGGLCYAVQGENNATELTCNCSLPFGGETCSDRKYRVVFFYY